MEYFIINIKKYYFLDAFAIYDGGDTVLLGGSLDLSGFDKSILLLAALFDCSCSL
jgi:hypothetical protein